MLVQSDLVLRRSAQHAPLAARAARRLAPSPPHLCYRENRAATYQMRLAKTETLNLALASGGLPPPHLWLLKNVMLTIAPAHAGINLRTA